MACGIYGIHNTVSGKWYVGQSVDIGKRNARELTNLRAGQFHENGGNNHIVDAWNKYGEAAFEWIVLEECSAEMLDDREIFWIREKDSFRNGYNQTQGGGGMRGFHPSEETRRKQSEAKKGARHPWYGKRLPAETCKKLSYAARNRSEQTRRKISEMQKGRSKESRMKAARAKMKPVRCIETGVIFPSVKDASRETGVTAQNICHVCKGRLKTTGGFHWEYVKKE